MPTGTDAQARSIEAVIDSNPRLQAAIARFRTAGTDPTMDLGTGGDETTAYQDPGSARQFPGAAELAAVFKEEGIAFPHDWQLDLSALRQTGKAKLQHESFISRNPWLSFAFLASPALIPGGGPAEAAATGGVGIGETGAVTGLAGSGFGGAAVPAAAAGGVGIGETAAVTGLEGSGLEGAAGGIGASAVGADGVASAAPSVLPSTPLPPGTGPGYPSPTGGGGGFGGTGASPILRKIGKVASKAAPILGKMAEQGAAANAARDARAPQMENAKLLRDKYALDAPTTRMNQSVRASILNKVKPTKVQWGGPGSGLRGEVPQFTGGYTGALQDLDPRTRELADTTLNKTLQDQLAGKDAQTTYLDDVGKTSTTDKIVGGASIGASIWDVIKDLI